MMKRPAAASATRGSKKAMAKAAASATAKAVKQAKIKSKSVPKAVAARVSSEAKSSMSKTGYAKPKAIVEALKRADGLPAGMRVKLPGLVQKAVAGKNGPEQEPVLALLEDTLAEAEDQLLDTLRTAQSAVDGADDDRESRDAAVVGTEAKLADLKRELAEAKKTLKGSEKAIGTSRGTLEETKTSYKCSGSELKTLQVKRTKLEFVAKDVFEPLKFSPAGGATGQKQVKSLCKTGKEFGFHEVLLGTLPAILKKELDKRRTFDGLALKQLDGEFSKCTETFGNAIKDVEASVGEKATAVQVAQDALAAAKLQQQTSARAIGDLEKDIDKCKQDLQDARSRLKSHKSDARKSIVELSRSKGKLIAFRKGPLSALGELQAILKPASDEPEADAAMSNEEEEEALPVAHTASSKAIEDDVAPTIRAEDVQMADDEVAPTIRTTSVEPFATLQSASRQAV